MDADLKVMWTVLWQGVFWATSFIILQEDVVGWQPFRNFGIEFVIKEFWKEGDCNSKIIHSILLYIELFSVDCCEAITVASQLIIVQGKHVQGMDNTCSFGLTSK